MSTNGLKIVFIGWRIIQAASYLRHEVNVMIVKIMIFLIQVFFGYVLQNGAMNTDKVDYLGLLNHTSICQTIDKS